MTDQEIIEEAVKQLKEWQGKVAKEEAERQADVIRRRQLIDEVQKQTGADRFDAARFVSYVMSPKPRPTNGDGIERGGF